MRNLMCAAALLLCSTAPAISGEVNDILTRHLYAGSLTEGGTALDAFAASADAKAAQGIVAFVAAVERLGQSFHRHGLETPGNRMMIQLPILRLPVPPNPEPEKLDYDKYRSILQTLLDDVSKTESLLASTGNSEVKLTIDLSKVRIDLDGDGKASDYETLGAMLVAMNGAPEPVAGATAFAFDNADIYWLRGYCQFIAAASQFTLAHNFQDMFDKTFHAFFPEAGLPLADALKRPLGEGQFSDGAIGDAIALIHLLNWPVLEPERLEDARLRLLAIAAMSRQSWAAARMESDNDREWVPNGKQTSAMTSMAVTDEVIDGWLAVMSEFESILDGKKLLPHWRFAKGFNVKRWFQQSKRFDAVLLATGTDAVPFLEDGPISSSSDWSRLTRVFQGSFLGYAIWFN